jgi:hypothetical protein
MEYAVEMASGGMIYIPSIMKIGTGVQIVSDIHTHAERKVFS